MNWHALYFLADISGWIGGGFLLQSYIGRFRNKLLVRRETLQTKITTYLEGMGTALTSGLFFVLIYGLPSSGLSLESLGITGMISLLFSLSVYPSARKKLLKQYYLAISPKGKSRKVNIVTTH